MRFPIYIASRYLISKKSSHIINWISRISMLGVSIGTMAMIIIMAVFSGLNSLITDLFSGFNPNIEITSIEGKRFDPDEKLTQYLNNHDLVDQYSFVLEDRSLVKYDEEESICTVKAVDSNYEKINQIDQHIYDGGFILRDGERPFAVVGRGLAMNLGIGLNFISPLVMYYPKSNINMQFPANSIHQEYVFPSGIFEIQNEIDFEYILVDLDYGRDLFNEPTRISSIEVRLIEGVDDNEAAEIFAKDWGSKYKFKTRLQQEELIFKTMKSEKLISVLILAFIILIASFNIIGSLTMLILDKKSDVLTLRSMGAQWSDIRKIFLAEGWLISFIGALSGLLLGILIIFLQDTIGLIPLSGDGNFIVQYYPVNLEITDIFKVLGIVLGIGFFTSWYPTRILIRRLIEQSKENNI